MIRVLDPAMVVDLDLAVEDSTMGEDQEEVAGVEALEESQVLTVFHQMRLQQRSQIAAIMIIEVNLMVPCSQLVHSVIKANSGSA